MLDLFSKSWYSMWNEVMQIQVVNCIAFLTFLIIQLALPPAAISLLFVKTIEAWGDILTKEIFLNVRLQLRFHLFFRLGFKYCFKTLPNYLVVSTALWARKLMWASFSASAIMSTKLTVSNLPNFRKSTLALHRINSMVNGNNETSQATNHEGFDDLRHFIKGGGEFSKELAATLADRAELEATYAKGLSKLAAKLFKVRLLYIFCISELWMYSEWNPTNS